MFDKELYSKLRNNTELVNIGDVGGDLVGYAITDGDEIPTSSFDTIEEAAACITKDVALTTHTIGAIVKKPLKMPDLRSKPVVAKWTEEDHSRGKCSREQIDKERTSNVRVTYLNGQALALTRRVRRTRVIDRSYTKSGYAFGYKIGGKTLNIAEHISKKNQEKIEKKPAEPVTKVSGLTNRERHYIRRKTRELR